MKKINFQVFALMWLALLFADVVPAAENDDSKKPERLWCFILCDIPPTAPSTPSDTTQFTHSTQTTTEKR